MRTLTNQEMLFVSGGAQEGDAPPKKKDDAGPSGGQVGAAALRCALAVAVTRKSPTYSNAAMAAVQCVTAVKSAGAYVLSRVRR